MQEGRLEDREGRHECNIGEIQEEEGDLNARLGAGVAPTSGRALHPGNASPSQSQELLLG